MNSSNEFEKLEAEARKARSKMSASEVPKTGCLSSAFFSISTIIVCSIMTSHNITFALILWAIVIIISFVILIQGPLAADKAENFFEKRVNEKKEFIDSTIEKEKNNGFTVSRQFSDACYDYVIAIDKPAKKWLIAFAEKNKVSKFTYSDLIDFEIYKDGNTLISGTSSEAIVGGAFFGTTGAVIGASGPREAKQNCTDLHINITINDLQEPIISIPLISTATDKDTALYKYGMVCAQSLAAILAIIKTNQAETAPLLDVTEHSIKDPKNGNCYEEIETLFRLKEMGILTEEEFSKKKSQILFIH